MISGLLAALGWGCADFGATVRGRRIGSLPTVIIAAVFGALATTVMLLVSGESLVGLGGIIWIVVINGVATSTAYYMHYRALELGPMAVVSPIGASYAVVGVRSRWSSSASARAPPALIGTIVTVCGVALVSTDLGSSAPASAAWRAACRGRSSRRSGSASRGSCWGTSRSRPAGSRGCGRHGRRR